VSARERGGRGPVTLDSRLADERRFGLGAGLAFVAPLAASTVLDRLLQASVPVTLRVCMRFRVRERTRPIGWCNPYFDGFEAVTDVADAARIVDAFDFAPLHIRRAAVSIVAERGVVDEVVVGARPLGPARPGSRLKVRVRLQRHGGGRRSLTVPVRVPRDIRPGRRTLAIAGNGFPVEDELILELIAGALTNDGSPGGPEAPAGAGRPEPARSAQTRPRTVRGLARRLARMRRPLGITAGFRRRKPRVVLRSDEIRFDGRVKLRLRVRPARRR
jgi:hypothetical protein